MPKAYSGDLRVRVIEMMQAGASRREAAEVFSLAGSTASSGCSAGRRAAAPRRNELSPNFGDGGDQAAAA